MTYLSAKQTLCSLKLNISYANLAAGKNTLFSLANIDDAMNYALAKIIDYKLWPFTEGAFTLTGSGPYAYEDGFEWESAFLAIVNGVPWLGEGKGKRNFPDYMKWFSDNASDNSNLWTEYGGELFFNVNALPANPTIVLYGKFVQTEPFVSPADDGQAIPLDFENGSDMTSANEALILLAYAFLLSSEKKKNPAQATTEETRAYAILDNLWGKIAERKAQLAPQNRPFFNVDDMFARSNRPTRYDTNIGNFP